MEDDVKNIFQELYEMFKKPWSIGFGFAPIFGSFGCCLIVVILNGLGVLCAFCFNKETLISSISQNLAIYSIALFAPSLIALFLQLSQNLIHNKVSFSIISIALLTGEIYAIPIAYQGNILFAIVSTLIAWFYWIIANRDNEYLNDESFDNLIKNNSKKYENRWNDKN